MRTLLIAFCLLFVSCGGRAEAAPVVRVLETYPAGQSITLPRNKNFYLHLAYETGKPIGIWIEPYFRGRSVPAGTSPSITYTGTGEALAWFFFTEPGLRADEIRIRAGDGGYKMPVVARYRVDMTAGSRTAPAANSPWAPREPSWVGALRDRTNRQIEANLTAAQSASSAGAGFIAGGFVLVAGALAVTGLAAPAWALRCWRSGWRLAAAAPLAVVSFVILRIAVDTSTDPTSHNLWPFELLLAGLASFGMIALLALARRISLP